jgi:flagellar hook assembly protein FlgD
LALHPNRPNPFNPETLIRFDLPTAQTVSLDIFNALGQKVRTLVQGRIAGGIHNVRWDSRDERGQAVATGPYFYRLSAGSSVQTQRMMLVK